MMAQAEGLTLHFKVPAVLPGSRAQAFVLVSIGRGYSVWFTVDANANRLELFEYRLEGSTDTRQCGSAFFVELPQYGFVALGDFVHAHILIVAATRTA